MAWTYDPTLARPLDLIRLLIGDTDASDPLLQDEEILSLLSLEGSVELAAARACDAIVARFSRLADVSAGGVSIQASQRAEAYRQRAAELRQRAFRGLTLYAGGRSWSEKVAAAADEDSIPPRFRRGQDDHPEAVEL